MSIFSESERELIDAARMVLSDGVRRLSARPSLFPTNKANSRADRQAAIDARNALCEHLIATYGPLRYEVAVAAYQPSSPAGSSHHAVGSRGVW